MNYTKQFRWLIFLLVPLIILLAVHFLIPVIFIVESIPLVKETMLQKNIEFQQFSMRSITMAIQFSIVNLLQELTNGQKILLQLLAMNQYQSLQVNSQNIVLNNCFDFAQSIENGQNNGTYIQSKSMWFATGIDQTQNLSGSQQLLLEQYKKIEPFVTPLFTDPQLMHSLTFYLVSNSSDSLYIEYPSRFSQKCSNLSNSVTDAVYTATTSLSSGQTAPFLENAADGTRLLSLCTFSKLPLFAVVSCLRLNLLAVGNILFSILSERQTHNLTSFLLLSAYSNLTSVHSNPQIALILSNNTVSTAQNMYFSDASSFNDLLDGVPTFFNSHLYLKQSNFTSIFFVPFYIGRSIPLRLVVEHQTENTTVVEGLSSEVVKRLLIPVLVLNVVVVFVTVVIIKSLLDSVDKELTDLDRRCKFIVKGDIDVQIPEHIGTKDIREVYDEARIINKLHRFTTQSYFSGHFAEKIPKYFQALQLIKKLGYDKSNIEQNIGETYMYVQEWQKAQKYLKKSVQSILEKIESQCGKINDLEQLKNKTNKLPAKYKQYELILIRRLFKLCYIYLNELEFGLTFQKIQELDRFERDDYLRRRTQHTNKCYKYLNLLKKAFSPHFSKNAECIIMMISEAKWKSDMDQLQDAKINIEKTKKYLENYTNAYDTVSKALEQKGSKFKFLRKKHKITTHSRVQPDILWMFRDFNLAKIIEKQSSSPEHIQEKFNILCTHLWSNYFTNIVMYITMFEIRKILVQLKIDTTLFQSTQLFRQVFPFKTLYYGEITPDVQDSLLRYACRGCEGLERQFVFVFDCHRPVKDFIQEDKELKKYHINRVHHIFNKLVSQTDRVSIVKYNAQYGVTVESQLVMKETKDQVLRHMLNETVKERYYPQKNKKDKNEEKEELLQAVKRVFHRVKCLKSEKILIFYFRSLKEYTQRKQKKKPQKRSSSPTKLKRMQSLSSPWQIQIQIISYSDLGGLLVSLLQDQQVRNLKVILECCEKQNREDFLDFFDLKNINRRIWEKNGGVNLNNNVVYIMSDVSKAEREEKEKGEIDRLLMSKSQHYADNSVFLL